MGRHFLWLSPLPGCGNSSQSPALFEALSLFTKLPSLSYIFSHTYSETPRRCWSVFFSPRWVLPSTHATQRRRSVCLFLHVICLSSAHLCYVSCWEAVSMVGKAQQNQLAGFESLFHLKCDLGKWCDFSVSQFSCLKKRNDRTHLT